MYLSHSFPHIVHRSQKHLQKCVGWFIRRNVCVGVGGDMQPPSGSVQIEHAQGAGARMRSGHRTRTRLEKCGWGFPPSRHAAASAYPQAPPPEEARRWSWWVVCEETRVRCWSRGCKGLGRIGGVGRWSTDSESQSAADGGPSEQLYGCGGGEQQVGALYFNFVCRCLRPRRGSSVHAGSFMAAGSSGRRGRAPAWPAPPPSPSP